MRSAIPFLAILLLILPENYGEKVSPCPELFAYEEDAVEHDRWYGTITLTSDADLFGVWLRVLLDKPAAQLGNWFGDVSTDDNRDFLIKNRKFHLKANKPTQVRLYVKFSPEDADQPRLISFRVNGRDVCAHYDVTTAVADTNEYLHTSAPVDRQALKFFLKPGGGFDPRSFVDGDDDDYFTAALKSRSADAFECGTVIMQPQPLITHGEATREGEFPWHAALYHARGTDLVYMCGASLVTRRHIVTVAHCASKKKSRTPLNAESLVVYLGKYYLKKWSNVGIQARQVQEVFVHPDFDPQTYGNDVALIELATSAEITDFVRPVCLWTDSVGLSEVTGRIGTVVGWGLDETGHITEQLTQAKMPVVSQDTCIYSFPDFFSRFTSNKTFCAGFRNGTSVCNGDSGGGMVFPVPKRAGDVNVWHLRGIVSISVALQNEFKCDSNHFVVFTDVSKYLKWIKATIKPQN